MKNRSKRRERNTCPTFIMALCVILGFYMYGIYATLLSGYDYSFSMDEPIFTEPLKNHEKIVLFPSKTEEEDGQVEDIPDNEMTDMSENIEDTIEEIEEIEEIQEYEPVEPEEIVDEYVSNELINEEGQVVIIPSNVTQFTEYNYTEPKSNTYINPGLRPLDTEYDYKLVEPSYFSNSIFIGDSRINGLALYSGYEEATFMYKVGLNIYNVMDANLDMGIGSKATVPEILSSREFENVYLMLGINELASYYETFVNAYAKVLARIRELQPNARIIIMGILYVTSDYDKNPASFNNDNINCRNYYISQFANGRTIFYQDANPVLVDETGGLSHEMTNDGVHMAAKYYNLWTDYLNSHGY